MPMNKRSILAILIFFLFVGISLPATAQEPVVQAKAAVLMDIETGQVLWERNGSTLLPPASTTKVLTSILAYEMGDVEKNCFISQKAAAVGEASLHLRAGETLTLGELLNGALICSGNDACVAIAENIAGTEAFFVHWMNNKCQILGATNSSFINTNGLPAENHLVSAYDLAMISRYALYNQEFSSVVRKRSEIIGQGTSKRYLTNTNKLLWNYPECIGVKTGTTNAAGPCLVSAAEKKGRKCLAVVLNSPDRYGDSYRLLEYGLNNFTPATIFKEGELVGFVNVNNGVSTHVEAEISSDESIILPTSNAGSFRKVYRLKNEILAPIKAGQSLGHIAVYDGENRLISTVNVTARNNIPEKLKWWEQLFKWSFLIRKKGIYQYS